MLLGVHAALLLSACSGIVSSQQVVCLYALAGRVVTHANEAGVLLNAVRPNTVRFMPPLTITVEEVDEAAGRLEEALKHI